MKKWMAILKISVMDALQYKAMGFVWFVTDTLFPVIMVYFWHKAFETQPSIAGKNEFQFVSYFLFSGFTVALIQAHPEFQISRHINHGDLSTFLLKPFNYMRTWFLYQLGYKVNRLLFICLSIPLWLIICHQVLGQIPAMHISILGIMIWILCFVIVYCLRYLVGLTAFWFTEIDWIIGLSDFMMFLVSGITIPLFLFPDWFQTVSSWLPFTYFAYTPTMVLLGNLSTNQMIEVLLKQIGWLLVLLGVAKMMWHHGLRVYTSYGS